MRVPLRILVTADAVGGVWTYALDLARGLAPHGIETLLALTGPAPSADERRTAAAIPSLTLIETGLPLDWLAETPEDIAQAAQTILRLAAEHDVDLIHLNTPALAAWTGPTPNPSPKGEGLQKSLSARSPSPSGEGLGWGLSPKPIPIITAAHSCVASWWEAAATGPLPPAFRWRSDLHAAGLHAATRAIAPTAAFADATHRLHGLRPTVVRNGRAHSPSRPTSMHDAALTVGRLWDKGKNMATLDRAAARLAVPLFAAGALSGPNGDSIELAHAHPLGHVSDSDLAARLAARPVFVSSALYEPFGLAVLEAAAAACALVLSDIPTFRELWDGCATFVDAHDDRAFTAAITDLIGDYGFRISQGGAARTRAAKFTAQAMAADTLAIYRSVLPIPEAVAA